MKSNTMEYDGNVEPITYITMHICMLYGGNISFDFLRSSEAIPLEQRARKCSRMPQYNDNLVDIS